ncbi:MAG: hypothetical protein E6G41_11225, partial [Actinobacteria bacterium]
MPSAGRFRLPSPDASWWRQAWPPSASSHLLSAPCRRRGPVRSSVSSRPVFHLAGLKPRQVTSAELELPSGGRRPVSARLVRAGARRGVLRLRLARRSVVGVAVASAAGATTLKVHTKAPSAPTNLTAAAGDSNVSLTWSASSGGRLSGYRVYMNGALAATVGLSTSYLRSGLSDGATYSFYVVAFDTAGNSSAPSSTVTATPQAAVSPPPPSDTTPPSTPTNVKATGGDTQVALSWSASSDDVGATGYRVYRDGSLVGSPSGTSFTDTGLTDGMTYGYRVAATDAAGNVSAQSGTVSATPVAPVPPASGLGGLLPGVLPESSGAVVSGSASQSLGALFGGLGPGSVLCLHAGTY